MLRADEIAAGVPVTVSCTGPCKVTGTLRVGRRVIGRGSAELAGKGLTYMFVRAKLPRARTLRPVLTVATPGGEKVATRRITLRR